MGPRPSESTALSPDNRPPFVEQGGVQSSTPVLKAGGGVEYCTRSKVGQGVLPPPDAVPGLLLRAYRSNRKPTQSKKRVGILLAEAGFLA